MPCIICEKDRSHFLRVPLESFSERRERYFRENFFTNHEYDHVCRLCSLRDGFWGGLTNALGTTFDVIARGLLVTLAVLVSYSAGLKTGASTGVLGWAPVATGLLFGGVLGVRFLRFLAFAVMGVLVALAVVVAGAYSDHLSIMPDVRAMVQREQIREFGEVRWSETDSEGRSIETTEGWDPIQASIDRAEKKRRERVMRFVRLLVRRSPFVYVMTEAQLRQVRDQSVLTLGIFYVLLAMLRIMLPVKEDRTRRAPSRRARPPGGR